MEEERHVSKKRAAVGYTDFIGRVDKTTCDGCAYLDAHIRDVANHVDAELDSLWSIIDEQNVKINMLIANSNKQSVEIKGLLQHVRPSRAVAIRKLLTDYRDKPAIIAVPEFCQAYLSKVTKGVTCLNYYIRQGDNYVHDGVKLASIADAIEARQEGEAKTCFRALFRSMYGDSLYKVHFPVHPRIECDDDFPTEADDAEGPAEQNSRENAQNKDLIEF